ncbi:MAG: PorV/PorQ family protein [Elusimicrobiota bacterium]
MLPESPFSSGAAGTTGAAFLKLARSARSEALGGAAVAGASDADALFSNPAGLSSLDPEHPSDLSFSYHSLLESAYLGYAAYGHALGRFGAVGGSVVYFSQGAMTAYTSQGDPNGTFAPNDLAVALSYAQRFRTFALGGSLKMIRSSVDDVSGATAALDIGGQAKNVCLLGDRPLDVGASLTNMGPAIKLGGMSAPLPLALALGALWHTTPNVDAYLDVRLPSDQDPYASFGLETNYAFDKLRRKAFLRAGYNQAYSRDIDGLTGLTAGCGLDLGAFRLDYAWVALGDLGMQNRVTLAFRF